MTAGDAAPAPGTGAGNAPRKRDRDEVFVEFTESICPVCKLNLLRITAPGSLAAPGVDLAAAAPILGAARAAVAAGALGYALLIARKPAG